MGQTTNEPVAGIARACGFSDAAWFSRAFASFHGCSPRAWRRRAPAAAGG